MVCVNCNIMCGYCQYHFFYVESSIESEMMIYQPLPVEIRVTLEQQSWILGSTKSNEKKGGEGFLMSYVQPRTSTDIGDLTTQFKKVSSNGHYNAWSLVPEFKKYVYSCGLYSISP